MQTKKFHISDVLSVTTGGRLILTRRMEGLHEILEFMIGKSLYTHKIPYVIDACKPFLLRQFPQLDTLQMQFAVGELVEMLQTPSGKKEPDKLMLGWISKLTSGQYGMQCEEMLEVKAIPIDELIEMDRPDRVVVITIS